MGKKYIKCLVIFRVLIGVLSLNNRSFKFKQRKNWGIVSNEVIKLKCGGWVIIILF